MATQAQEKEAFSFGLEMISNWKDGWKMYSVWMFAIIAAMPELYELAVSMGVVPEGSGPEFFNRALTLLAFIGAASRLVKQKNLQLTTPTTDVQEPAQSTE